MKILIDECVGTSVGLEFERLGHDVVYAAHVLGGAPDPEVLAHARRVGAMVISHDRGMPESVLRGDAWVLGLAIVREEAMPEGVSRLLQVADQIPGNVVIVGRERVRVRPIPALPEDAGA